MVWRAKVPYDTYFQGAAAELLESVAELDAAHSRGEGSVRSPWQAQAAPALAGRAGAIHVASTSHPSAVADHSPPSATVETAAGSNAAARKVGKRPVQVPSFVSPKSLSQPFH